MSLPSSRVGICACHGGLVKPWRIAYSVLPRAQPGRSTLEDHNGSGSTHVIPLSFSASSDLIEGSAPRDRVAGAGHKCTFRHWRSGVQPWSGHQRDAAHSSHRSSCISRWWRKEEPRSSWALRISTMQVPSQPLSAHCRDPVGPTHAPAAHKSPLCRFWPAR